MISLCKEYLKLVAGSASKALEAIEEGYDEGPEKNKRLYELRERFADHRLAEALIETPNSEWAQQERKAAGDLLAGLASGDETGDMDSALLRRLVTILKH